MSEIRLEQRWEAAVAAALAQKIWDFLSYYPFSVRGLPIHGHSEQAA
jgi:hypothetical protein